MTLSDEELLRLLLDLESDRVERKASLSDKDKVAQAVCAFANDLPGHRLPGVVFVGANDRDGSPSGLPVTDDLLLNLADLKTQGNILPPPSISVQKRVLNGGEMAVVAVQPADAPPVRFQGRTWIRVGPRRGVATVEEERRLAERRRAGDLPHDLRPVHGASIDDLDLQLFERTYMPCAVAPDIIAENQRSLEDRLLSLRMVAAGDPLCPTVLGVLVLGKQPRDWLPGAYVQFLRIRGTSLTDPIVDQAAIEGALSDVMEQVEAKITAHIEVRTDVTSAPTEIRRPTYPLVALQQLVRNAILHRSYEWSNAPVRITWFDDRIEIQNPGGPYGQVRRDNFGQAGLTDYRNPHLAEAARNLGYVQKFGMGIQLARDACARNANPDPEFDVDDTGVLVRLWSGA